MSSKNGVQYPVDQRILQKQTKDALTRLKDLEDTLPQVVNGFQQAVNNLQQGLNSLTEIMDAVIEINGSEKITSIMAANRTKKAQAQAEAEQKGLDAALLNGDVVASEAITEKTIVVGKEFNADGTVKTPGYVQAPFMRIAPEFQEKLKGQKAGFSFDLPNGGKFEVLATYDVVEKTPEPAPVIPEPAPTAPPAAGAN